MSAKTIGSGAFGEVWAYPDERIAVKIIHIKKEGLCNLMSAVREIHVLKYKNKYLVPFKSIDFRYSSIEIHMQQMTIDLHKKIKTKTLVDTDDMLTIAADCLHGIQFLHTHFIAHRDMKPSNILLNITNDRIRAKLCDFGLARQFSNELHRGSDYMVTRWYRAPEVINVDESYGLAIDIWAMGCIVYEMARGKPMFPLAHASELEQYIQGIPHRLKKIKRKELSEVANMMLKKDPEQRCTAADALEFLEETVEEESTQRYYEDDITISSDYKKKYQQLLDDYKDHHRVIMHGMMLFNGTPQSEFDFNCSMVIAHLLFESNCDTPFFNLFWEKDGMNCKKVAGWVCIFMDKYPHVLSMWEKTKQTKDIMNNIFTDVIVMKNNKKRKLR
jgi:serine/threonine protein kinase